MSLLVTEKDGPRAMADHDSKAHMEDREIVEPEMRGESGRDEAEESGSAVGNKFREDDGDEEFDEDADWSYDEEGKVVDIEEEYNIVWTEIWGAEAKGYEDGDSMSISGSADPNQKDKPFRCTATFTWRNFIAQFTCIYRPETRTFTDFKAKRKTLDGGMQGLCGVTVRMWEESCRHDSGKCVAEKKDVKDDRGNSFLYMQSDFGNIAGAKDEAFMYGKKVVKDGGRANIVLTEGEKERLHVPWSEHMVPLAHDHR